MRMCACRGTAGFAHVSCLAEQAKILFAEALENHLDVKVKQARWKRWYSCSLCEQSYHGVVQCALGWACWKTYVGRPETDQVRGLAMTVLGNGLSVADHHEDALVVREADLSMARRLGDSAGNILVTQTNLACTYEKLGRHVEAERMRKDVYSRRLELSGEENKQTLVAAHNYAESLLTLESFEEAKALLRKTLPVARRVLGENDLLPLSMRTNYARALYQDPSVTLSDLREAVSTLEEIERTARRVLGGGHPTTGMIEVSLRKARAALSARDVSSLGDAMAAMTPQDAQDPSS